MITGGESVTLDGSVDGSVLAGAETLTVSSPRIGRNLFGGGESVNVTDASSIEQNMLVGGEKVALAGRVGHDVLGGGEELEVASTIGGALTTYSKRMRCWRRRTSPATCMRTAWRRRITWWYRPGQ